MHKVILPKSILPESSCDKNCWILPESILPKCTVPMSVMPNSTFMSTPHAIHVKCDFLNHTSCQIRLFWQHIMTFMSNSNFLTLPHISHATFYFHDHTSCHSCPIRLSWPHLMSVMCNSIFLTMHTTYRLSCFLYFSPSRIWSTNYSVLVLID